MKKIRGCLEHGCEDCDLKFGSSQCKEFRKVKGLKVSYFTTGY